MYSRFVNTVLQLLRGPWEGWFLEAMFSNNFNSSVLNSLDINFYFCSIILGGCWTKKHNLIGYFLRKTVGVLCCVFLQVCIWKKGQRKRAGQLRLILLHELSFVIPSTWTYKILPVLIPSTWTHPTLSTPLLLFLLPFLLFWHTKDGVGQMDSTQKHKLLHHGDEWNNVLARVMQKMEGDVCLWGSIYISTNC